MTESTPPPLPQSATASSKRTDRLITIIALTVSAVVAACFATLFVLRIFGFLRPFSVPTGAMSPAITAGDHIVMEGLTYLTAKPQRGDIVVFKTDGIPSLPNHTIYVKRLVGLPGDHLALSGGALYVNGERLPLHNKDGQIHYITSPVSRYLAIERDTVTVPEDRYFVLGDNSALSSDSRF